MNVRLEYGKRYVTRDGRVTGPLVSYGQYDYKFACYLLKQSWLEDGANNYTKEPVSSDLVAEYQEPKEERVENKFKVGDRVAVYSFFIGAGFAGKKGTIKELEKNKGFFVVLDDGGGVSAHVKQCRRLKKKERREFWVAPYNGNFWPTNLTDAPRQFPGIKIIRVRVIEERTVE